MPYFRGAIRSRARYLHVPRLNAAYFGWADRVQACGDRLLVEAVNKAEDTASINVVFASGAVANVVWTFAAQHCGFPTGYMGAGLRYDLYGSEGALHLVNEMQGPALIVMSSGCSQTLTSKQIEASLPGDVPVQMNQHFIECIRNDTELIVTLEQELHIVRVVDACYPSMASGKTETVGS